MVLIAFVDSPPLHIQTAEYATQGQTVKFLDDSLEFATVLAQVVPVIENLMQSKINSDVFEAIEFFTTATLFGIKGTEPGMRKMLFLVWSGDKEKTEAVSRAYRRVLFGTDQKGRMHAVQVVANLSQFYAGLTQGQFSAMEVLMREWIDNDDIDNTIIQVLFERVTLKLPDTSENDARLALQLLITAATVRPSIVGANFELIQSIAFGERSVRDPRLFAMCQELMCCQTGSADGGGGGGGKEPDGLHRRYDGDTELIRKAMQLYQRLFFVPTVRDFDAVTKCTLDMLYHFGATPDLFGQQLVQSLCQRLADSAAQRRTGAELVDTLMEEGRGDDEQTMAVAKFVAPRLMHLIGYLALKELVFLDIDVYSNMKHRQNLADQLKKAKKANRNGVAALLNVSVADGNSSRRSNNINSSIVSSSMSASKALKRLSESGVEPQQDVSFVYFVFVHTHTNNPLIFIAHSPTTCWTAPPPRTATPN